MSKNLPNPKTRIEHYLNKLAKGETTTLPEPVTRVECYLDEIANSGGGGGGSDLPTVTSDDNGKVLKVIEGAWDKGTESGGASDLLVNFAVDTDEGTVTTITSIADIVTAINGGTNVRCAVTEGDSAFVATGKLDGYVIDEGVAYIFFSYYYWDGEHNPTPYMLSAIMGANEGEDDSWFYVPCDLNNGDTSSY